MSGIVVIIRRLLVEISFLLLLLCLEQLHLSVRKYLSTFLSDSSLRILAAKVKISLSNNHYSYGLFVGISSRYFTLSQFQ